MGRNKLLQLAFNHDFAEVVKVIGDIPQGEDIIIEAGTPLIKREGIGVIAKMRQFWRGKICADIKVVDGAKQEVEMAKREGADFVTAVGNASPETLRLFVATCRKLGITSVVDMINTPKPLRALWKANVIPDAVLIHRGRDEENSFGKVIQYKNIAKIKGKYNVLVGAAGGIDGKELQSAIFNGADLAVVNLVQPNDPWKGLVIGPGLTQRVKKFLSFLK